MTAVTAPDKLQPGEVYWVIRNWRVESVRLLHFTHFDGVDTPAAICESPAGDASGTFAMNPSKLIRTQEIAEAMLAMLILEGKVPKKRGVG